MACGSCGRPGGFECPKCMCDHCDECWFPTTEERFIPGQWKCSECGWVEYHPSWAEYMWDTRYYREIYQKGPGLTTEQVWAEHERHEFPIKRKKVSVNHQRT